MPPIVQLRDLTKSYPMGDRQLPVLKNICMSVEPGEYVAIMGPSGSGKSTLLNLLGLLDVPDSGDYFLAGENVAQLPDDDLSYHRNLHIGFIFQSFNLFPQLDVAGNIAVPMMYAGVNSFQAAERAAYLADLVGLSHRLHHRCQKLSGGEMQRTAIARALSTQPPLLLADEPTGNLDEKTGNDIMDLFDRLVADGQTLLMVTHNPAYQSRVHRTLRLRDGMLADPVPAAPPTALPPDPPNALAGGRL
jgi:putative ABC transport system ATP-binding protein